MADTLRRMLESGELTETLRQMLESGKLTDVQCLSILQVLDSDGCTSEKVIEEKAVKRLNKRISLTQLLDMRDPEKSDLRRCYEEELDEQESKAVDERYYRQLQDSQFFDIDRDVRIPRWKGFLPLYFGEKEEEQQPPPEMVLYGRLGVHWFNFEHNRNLKFLRIPKLNNEHPFSFSYYITVEVGDVDAAAAAGSSPSSFTLQILVKRLFFPELEVMIERCRIKPTTAKAEPHSIYDHFMYYGVDAFYRDRMPTFLSGPPEEAADDQRFYEVPDEDIRKNDWLLLYARFALFKLADLEMKEFLASDESESDDHDDEDSIEGMNRKKVEKSTDKYRALIEPEEVDSDKDVEEENDQDMEVTFNTGLEDLSKEILKKKDKKSESVWESSLRQKREKKRARKNNQNDDDSSADDDYIDRKAVKDDDGDDDFFMEEPNLKKKKKERREEEEGFRGQGGRTTIKTCYYTGHLGSHKNMSPISSDMY